MTKNSLLYSPAGWIASAVFSLLPCVSSARMGETADQCADRYGEPVATVEKRLGASDDGALRFLKDDVGITVEFKDGKAWVIRFERRYLNEELLQGLLAANEGGTAWEGPHKYDGRKFWMTVNKEFHAMFTEFQGAVQLMVLNDTALKAMEEERKKLMELVGTVEADEWVDKYYGSPKAEGF